MKYKPQNDVSYFIIVTIQAYLYEKYHYMTIVNKSRRIGFNSAWAIYELMKDIMELGTKPIILKPRRGGISIGVKPRRHVSGDEGLRGLRSIDFLPRDKNGIPYDPELGPPDEQRRLFKELSQYKPKPLNSHNMPAIVFGTAGGNVSVAEYFKQMWDTNTYNANTIMGPGWAEQIMNFPETPELTEVKIKNILKKI